MVLEGLVVAGEVVHVRPPPLAPPPPLLPLPLLLSLLYCPPLMLLVVDTTVTSTARLEGCHLQKLRWLAGASSVDGSDPLFFRHSPEPGSSFTASYVLYFYCRALRPRIWHGR